MDPKQLLEIIQQQQAQAKLQHEQAKLQQEQMMKLMKNQQDQFEKLVQGLSLQTASSPHHAVAAAIPKFDAFDSSCELWTDYWMRFQAYLSANSVPEDKMAHVFLTNQHRSTFKMLENLASQENPPKKANELSLQQINEYMKEQFDSRLFVVRERFKFWSDTKRKPGESIQELAARIRQKASTCDFTKITNPLDEAMRTNFVCSINNEAVLKALFKVNDDNLTFSKAIEIATEVEDAAKYAKETIYGKPDSGIHKVDLKQKKIEKQCSCCGKKNHSKNECRFKDSKCHYCKKPGHLAAVCFKKKQKASHSSTVRTVVVNALSSMEGSNKMNVKLELQKKIMDFEVDTGSTTNFITHQRWKDIGSPKLTSIGNLKFKTASGHELPTYGCCKVSTKLPRQDSDEMNQVYYVVADDLGLNLIGIESIKNLKMDLNAIFQRSCVNKIQEEDKTSLQKACEQLCTEFPEVFKPELGCVKDIELEIEFKPDVQPKFCKPRPVPFAMQEELERAYDEGIAKGVWEPVRFNEFGTPVVPIRKAQLPNQPKPKLRVCGDYSITVNPMLEAHHQPLPLPEDLLQKLSGGQFFSKLDLSEAYNQIRLGPVSQRRLALSTHRGVLLQKRLPYGIKSAPGYFQEYMEKLTRDLPGVAVYLDDILVSGKTSDEHLSNLKVLLQRLQDVGLRCNLKKCSFAQQKVEYLGHVISGEGISKGRKADALLDMPNPKDASEVKSFLSKVQFYGKFLPDLATVAEPLFNLTRKNTIWKWGKEESAAYRKLKEMLAHDNVLAHFEPTQRIGISCDASAVGLGVVLFHRYSDGSERPIAFASKTLTSCQRRYGQIQREALSIVFGLKKFHQFLYGRHFILITDHKPLVSLFSPNKATPALAANRLARWALTLSQYDYEIEYRKTSDHGNADALSRLPVGPDPQFDMEEGEEDTDIICTIKTIACQLSHERKIDMAKESAKDPIISTVIRYTREGWPTKLDVAGTEPYKKIENSLSISNGCLLYGSRLVIPEKLRSHTLKLLHLGHLGMVKMKQLARTAVYWPGIDSDIENAGRRCISCAEHQNTPEKAPVHPWMLPERPWSRVHVDHAVNFCGSNWLVLVDAHSKYPCIHATSSLSTKATTDLLEQDFAHFGYPHALVSDNGPAFASEEFREWCRERGIVHLTGAPYHPATNGAAERLVQSFKQAVKKSTLAPKMALQEFLIQYRRTPQPDGRSPSEMLNGRQIRTKIDVLLPSPVHAAQERQVQAAKKTTPVHKVHDYKVGDPCYSLYFGQRRDKDPRWVPGVITKICGPRSVVIRGFPKGPFWKRHIDQVRPRYGADQDGEVEYATTTCSKQRSSEVADSNTEEQETVSNQAEVNSGQLPRRSNRTRKPNKRYYSAQFDN